MTRIASHVNLPLPLPKPGVEETRAHVPATLTQPNAAPTASLVASSFGTAAPRGFTPATVAPPPRDLQSAQAQVAIDKSLAYLNAQGLSRANAADAYRPSSVTSDALGMTHVRLDRTHEGVPVFAEQIISHLDVDNEVRSITGAQSVIPSGLGSEPLAVSEEAALAIATEAFSTGAGAEVGGRTEDDGVSLQRFIYRDERGEYRNGYLVELTNLFEGEHPLRMQYMVDAQTGQVAFDMNAIGGLDLHDLEQAAPVEVKVSATPDLAIRDRATVTSTLQVTEDLTIDKLAVGLDLQHPYRGDLIVTLTSPAGTTAVLSNREGGPADDLKGDFDLSAFAGESAKGAWTLSVEDAATRDEGVLEAWGLNILGIRADAPPEPTEPVGDDTSLYAGGVDLSTTQRPDGSYELSDPTRGKGVVTLDAQNKLYATDTVSITDDNDVWGETTDDRRHDAAVDAHYGAQMTYDFYRDIFGRDSIDGAGELLQSNVHIRENFVNAFWDGTTMNYGDGDGRNAGPLTTLDIAGHEITHGLTERTAGLIYRGESGGINEAMSDIVGTGVEWYAAQRNPAVTFDWMLGEDAWTPGTDGDALRYMDDPTRDGRSIDHYSQYTPFTDVHYSSGIMNNAFVLLTQGGTNRTSGMSVEEGIGMDKAQRIFGRALIYYMTKDTTFAQAREATINAATDLYGADSVEVATLEQAWSAVGVE